MTLSEILARGVQLELHESIAVMSDVLAHLPQARLPVVPELGQIELLPSGQVRLLGGSAVAEPVQRLAQTLQTLLVSASPPVQLRVLLAEPPESIEEFAEALAYFERPNRAAILQDLLSRASGTSPSSEADLIASLRAATPAPASDDQRQAPAGRRRRLYVAAGIAAILIIAAGAGLALMRRGDFEGSFGGGPSTLAAKVSQGVSDVTATMGAVASSIGERVSLRNEKAAEAPAAAVEQPATAVPVKPRSERLRPAAARPDVLPTAGAAGPRAAPLRALPGGSVSNEWMADAIRRIGETPEEDQGVVYSAASSDVTPPVGVRPFVPKPVPEGAAPEGLVRIEVVVGPEGRVESVKLLSQPRLLHDSMLLSAAKAWRFRPAMKDGQPVRYRTSFLMAR